MPTVITGSSVTLGADGTSSMHAVSKQQIVSLVPPGAVMPFAMATPPTGWLKCNGQLVSRTTYADLFLAIGTIYGAGDGTTTFQLPDLRGEFIRALDDGRGVDSGRSVGSAQTDQMPSHRHFTVYNGGTEATSQYSPTVTSDKTVAAMGASGYEFYTLNAHSLDANGGKTSATGGTSNNSENRPRNIALLYCIKY